MSLDNSPRAILGRFYDAERIYMANPNEAGSFEAFSKTFAEDIRVMQTPALPYGGAWEGIAGFRAWSEQMSDLFDVVDVMEPEVFESKDSPKVMINGKLRLKVRRTQKTLIYPFCQLVAVDTNRGVVQEIVPFYWDVHDLLGSVQAGREGQP